MLDMSPGLHTGILEFLAFRQAQARIEVSKSNRYSFPDE